MRRIATPISSRLQVMFDLASPARCRLRWLLAAVLLATLSSPAQPQSLSAIGDIGKSGAPGLALRLMDARQPALDSDPAGWFEWERERIALLEHWRQWQRGLERLRTVPKQLTTPAQRWIQTRRVWFLLALGETRQARRELRELIWHTDGASELQRQTWRQLVMRSYLVDTRYPDALRAMRRYQQDYRDDNPAWRILRARVLLSAGKGDGVEATLEGIDSDEARALRALARLRTGTEEPAALFDRARKLASEANLMHVRAIWWSVAGSAADTMSSSARRALALDQGIRFAPALDPNDALFQHDPARLWSAYRRYGDLVGNNVQLLRGNDQAWLEEAEKSLPMAPVRARALLSVIATDGSDQNSRAAAHRRIAELLANEQRGYFVLKALYLDTQLFPDVVDVPVSVRYRLADFALGRAEIELATRIMATLTQPPEGADAFDWQLRRARILTMGGRTEQAAAILGEELAAQQEMAPAAMDRLLQVVFDLQAVGAHEPVVLVLEQLLRKEIGPERRREILFWRADSLKALERHTDAAYDFMRSATLVDATGTDPWGQTARYNAAEALAKGGLVDDAERIYKALLRITENPDRKGVLRLRLQQLWLRDAAGDNIAED